MLKLNEEELKDLDYFAGLLFSDEDLAKIIQIEPGKLKAELRMEGSTVAATINSARYKAEASLREAILKMAYRGSSPAQNIGIELLKKLGK